MLAISTSLTTEENKADLQPVDEERRKFFFDCIKSIRSVHGCYQDDIEVIKRSLEELRTHPTDSDICSGALQNVMDLVDHIDVATDFMKLGGFTITSQYLHSHDSDLVRLAAEIIGIAVQNHPLCQQAVIENSKIFQDLFDILESPLQKDSAKLKAVFAISSTIQNNREGHDKFIKFNGYDVFLNILKSASIPLRLRICFVIDCLCSQFPEIKSMLLEKSYINCLIELLTKIPVDESKEIVISAMLTFIEGFYDAIKECRKEEHNLKPTLDYLIAHYKNDAMEEKCKAVKLLEELDKFAE